MARTAILIVENEAIISKDIQRRLEALGYGVVGTAKTAKEAVQIATGMRPDLVLMDVRLNGKTDGIEAAERIRDRLDVPIIFLTAYADDTTLARARATEPSGYLLKPFEGKELQIVVEIAMSKHHRSLEIQERVAVTMRSLDEGVIAVDAARHVTSLNLVAATLTGWNSAQAIGRSLPEVLRISPGSTRHDIEDALTRVLQNGGEAMVREHQTILVAKDGTETPIAYSAAPIRVQGGTVAGAVLVFSDLTEGRRAEQALQQALSDLAKSHGELRNAQLQLIQAEKLESIGRLAAGVAHEVKNPLATILTGVEYLEKHLAGGDASLEVLLHDMEEAVVRADAVIQGLLDFSGPTELKREPEALNAIVERSLWLVKHELTRAHTTVIKELARDLPSVRVDRHKLHQVFINLFLNAAQAMPEKGTLTVRTYVTELTEIGRHVGRRTTDCFTLGETVAVTEIDDTGSGIPEEKLARVFDPFFTTKPVGKGTGLGLAVTKKIIELHGGIIEMKNRRQGGVRATVMLRTGKGVMADGKEADSHHR